MIVTILVLILVAAVFPGLVRSLFAVVGMLIMAVIVVGMFAGPASPETWRDDVTEPWRTDSAETWREDEFGPPTWRSDRGQVWRRDEFGPPTWRSDDGRVCKQDTIGPPTWRCH